MHKLVEYICDELEELERKAGSGAKLSMAEVQYMDTLAHAKKNLLKGEEMMEGDGGYSSMSRDGRSYRYDRRGSYDMDGKRYDRSEARGRRNAKRDAMGRYSAYDMPMSYADSVQEMVESIHGMMDELPENVRHDAEKFVKKVESMM